MLNEVSSEEFAKILESSPIALALSDSEQKITWVNETFQNYLGITAEEISGTSISDLPVVLQPLFTNSSSVHIPKNAIRDDQWYMCNATKLNKNTIHYITDIGPTQLLMQEREYLKDELRIALAVDEVTGMPNKISLFQNLEPQISRSRRYNNKLSIVILRMHNLDDLNTVEIASLLVPVSQMLNDQVRWADMVGKLSDSDFLMILPETEADGCIQLCENLQERLDDLPIQDELPDSFNITVSFGYAEWSKGDDLTLLLQKARKNLLS